MYNVKLIEGKFQIFKEGTAINLVPNLEITSYIRGTLITNVGIGTLSYNKETEKTMLLCNDGAAITIER